MWVSTSLNQASSGMLREESDVCTRKEVKGQFGVPFLITGDAGAFSEAGVFTGLVQQKDFTLCKVKRIPSLASCTLRWLLRDGPTAPLTWSSHAQL